jgi:hypothetical protein
MNEGRVSKPKAGEEGLRMMQEDYLHRREAAQSVQPTDSHC